MTTTGTDRLLPSGSSVGNPWPALWAMVVGFFMILVDSTIVAVANPSIMADLQVGYDTVIWVTSAYLLAYAVPLLVAGRLGDRYGPKNLYLIGLAVFTVASLWCGLSASIGMLITARVVQGVGAALLTPQTLSTITRIFPADRRGMAMSIWGATAGVATLIGPLAGGVLVDRLGWEWIFFVNVPIGVIGLAMAARLIPVLPTQPHRFDLIGVVLSAAGIFLIVFALQEGQSHHWQPWIWAVIVAGIGLMVGFVYWQSVNTREPLIPLHIFADRNFGLANLAVAVVGFASVALVLPVMFYAQGVCGLSPTRAALLTAPMAVMGGLLAPVVGRIVDWAPPRPVVGFGFSVLAIGMTWLAIDMTPTTPIWRLLLVFGVIGVGNAFIWSPLAATATRNLPPQLAGAGSGVFNATRQLGAVLGSAGMAAIMTWWINAEMPALPGGARSFADEQDGPTQLQLPEFLREPFAAAMSQSALLPAFVAVFGVVAALFMIDMVASIFIEPPSPADRAAEDVEAVTEVLPIIDDQMLAENRLAEELLSAAFPDDFFDSDFYDFNDFDFVDAEFVDEEVSGGNFAEEERHDCAEVEGLDGHILDEEVLGGGSAADADRFAGADTGPVAVPLAQTQPRSVVSEPVRFAHNGFRIDRARHFQPLARFAAPVARRSDDTDELYRTDVDSGYSGSGRHHRTDDTDTYGRHAVRDD